MNPPYSAHGKRFPICARRAKLRLSRLSLQAAYACAARTQNQTSSQPVRIEVQDRRDAIIGVAPVLFISVGSTLVLIPANIVTAGCRQKEIQHEEYKLQTMTPLLKWPGGKRRLIAEIERHVPQSYGRYFEPFCGGAALFFFLEPKSATISDSNSDLIECYDAICEHPNEVIEVLSGLPNTKQKYYEVRSWRANTEIERAARLIYLCRLSFNGIYRVNLSGVFNVPYGYKTHLSSCDTNQILMASKVLTGTTLLHGDFERSISSAAPGDLIYFDPPYTVAHSQNGFIKYNSKIFSWSDQERLANVAETLRQNGCHVLVSNASHESIRSLYGGFSEVLIERQSVIAAAKNARKLVEESLFVGTPNTQI